MRLLLLAAICIGQFGLILAAQSAEKGMAYVVGGILKPFYPPSPKEREIPVHTFWMNKFPVTEAQFLQFVKKKPQWRRDHIKRIFADKQYLSHWVTPISLGNKINGEQPVTQVSWFAAKAYCESEGKRLPTENEWEYVAGASDKKPDASKDLEWRNRILDWYTKPTPSVFPKVGQSPPNYWGVYYLHGIVWEWVLDFNSSLVSSDNRENATSPDKNRFCGAGALVATEKDDYASFMRIAFRTSLKAHYTTSSLGFRCAQDEKKS